MALIVENGCRLDTGFVSGPYLLDVLCANGRRDMAYKLLFQTECPSWLYAVERGATTIWETWDAVGPEGQINTASFNHYAFGCVGDWLYRFVAGLDKDQPGYKHILIQPDLAGGLTHASASYLSGYGEIISAWELQQGRLTVRVQIPPNTSASIRLPGADAALVGQQCPPGMLITRVQDGGSVTLEVGSGVCQFEYRIDPDETILKSN